MYTQGCCIGLVFDECVFVHILALIIIMSLFCFYSNSAIFIFIDIYLVGLVGWLLLSNDINLLHTSTDTVKSCSINIDTMPDSAFVLVHCSFIAR